MTPHIVFTAHALARMAARGIPARAVEAAVRYARPRADGPGGQARHHVPAPLARIKRQLRGWSHLTVVTDEGREAGTRVVVTAYISGRPDPGRGSAP